MEECLRPWCVTFALVGNSFHVSTTTGVSIILIIHPLGMSPGQVNNEVMTSPGYPNSSPPPASHPRSGASGGDEGGTSTWHPANHLTLPVDSVGGATNVMIDLGDFSMETSAPCKMTHRGGGGWIDRGEVRDQGVDYGAHHFS